jgi:Mg2+ and Co2+ transporter CorA
MAVMDSFLITVDGSEHEVSTGTVRRLLDTSARFWLDLADVDKSTADGLLRDTFGFHPLAVHDAEHFGQRPKIDAYDDVTLMVVYGATGRRRLVEVHCLYTETYLITVHRDACPELTALATQLKQRAEPRPDHVMLLYLVVNTLIDGYFPVLADLDDQIDALEDAILQRPTDQQLGQLFDMKRWLIALRKVVDPQRDMFATLASGADALPGMTPDAERYYRALERDVLGAGELDREVSGGLDREVSGGTRPGPRVTVRSCGMRWPTGFLRSLPPFVAPRRRVAGPDGATAGRPESVAAA